MTRFVRLNDHRIQALTALLAVLTLAVFWSVLGHGFVEMDDGVYLFENPMVKKGLTLDGAIWAFRSFYAANWHPVSWLSHMLDAEMYGLKPWGHHLSGLLIHVANVLLLFFFLRAATGNVWPSFITAALFGVHPMHVESVAWVSERKDVLSALFGFLAMAAYLRYARRPTPGAYAAVIAAVALSLMSKPMLVTFPVIALLLDWWPLGRFRRQHPSGAVAVWRGLFKEKIPFVLMSLMSALITYRAQEAWGTVASFANVPFNYRLANAATSCLGYLSKLFWPADLAAYYPFAAAGVSAARALACCLILALIGAAAVVSAKKRPFLFFGWGWYAVTLAPVIGLVQVGSQAMADRYSYLPYVGLFVMLAWGTTSAVPTGRLYRGVIITSWIGALAALALAAQVQAGYWRDSITLFEHALKVTDRNYMAEFSLGNAKFRRGDRDAAEKHFRRVVEFMPSHAQAYNNLGKISFDRRRTEEAAALFRRALALDPGIREGHLNLGATLYTQGFFDEALSEYRRELERNPLNSAAHYNLGQVLGRLGRIKEAAASYGRALEIDPSFSQARIDLQMIQGRH